MESHSQSDFLWNVHQYLNEYIRFADAKAELVIGWTSALIGVLVASNFHEQFARSISGGLSFAGFGLLIIGFSCAFFAVIPRLRTSQPTGFIFWKSVRAHKSKDIFLQSLEKQTGPALNEHLAGHLYDLSGIADDKFWWVNRSIVCAFLGSLLSGIMYLYHW